MFHGEIMFDLAGMVPDFPAAKTGLWVYIFLSSEAIVVASLGSEDYAEIVLGFGKGENGKLP